MYGGSTGAQTATDPIAVDIVSLDAAGGVQGVPNTGVAAVSDQGSVIAYEAIDPVTAATPSTPRIWIHDRAAGTHGPVAELASVAPGISADGCLVAYSVLGAERVDAALTVVDRCAADDDQLLPIGSVIDTIDLAVLDAAEGDTADPVEGDAVDPAEGDAVDPADVDAVDRAEVGPPALSFDGSTIVWSTGSEIRRYERSAIDQPFVRTHAFDVSTTPTAAIVTGPTVDVSADGGVVVFTAGPGTEPYAPTPANVYLWTSETPTVEPELVSSTATGEPGAADSTSPTISGDGSFVVFESTGTDLAAVDGSSVAVPFVVGFDRAGRTAQVLVDDATRPAVSSDGFHVVYQRGDAVRVLSSAEDATVDSGPDELAAAAPTGAAVISQHGRWLVFPSAVDLRTEPAPTAAPLDGAAMWIADRTSSNPDVADTTTTTTTIATSPTTTIATSPTTTIATPPTTTLPSTTIGEASAGPTIPASTLPATPIINRFPTGTGSFPRVAVPPTVPRPTPTRPVVSTTRPPIVSIVPASATPVSFEGTVVDAGRRVRPLTLFNSTTSTIGITATTVEPAGPFSVVSDVCAGIRLAPSSSCVVEVQFAPVDVGPASAVASFLLDDGTIVSAPLDGDGVPEPTLDLVPAVAGAGQTVTVFGAGFPPGSTVELTQPGVANTRPVVVDPDGTFAHVVVVLPNTPTGPGRLAVVGQPDLFAGVDAELLVSSRGTTSDGAALRSSLGNPSRG